MNHREPIALKVGICLVLLALTSSVTGEDASEVSAYYDRMGARENDPIAATAMPGSDVQSQASSLRDCLPFYGAYQYILTMNEGDGVYEAFPTSADLNNDGLQDIIMRRTKFLTYDTFELDILLNDGHGGMILATPSTFSGTVPAVQNPTQVIVADFNGDGRPDIFVADHGYDDVPFPGYQNTLVLTAPDGKLVDATGNLPQQSDFTHSAAAADVDGDGDIDLYCGNVDAHNDIDPQILLNSGSGEFAVGENRLPPSVDLDENHYTSCEFSDVDNDGSPDLILGGHHGSDSVVLLNNGTGVFTPLYRSMPPKEFSSSDIAHDIEPLDLNGDDYVDLFIEYERPQGVSYIQVLMNNQDGTFRNETASRLESWNRLVSLPELELRDLDRDGDLDLLAMPWDAENPDPLLFLNDGSGHFSWKPFGFGLRDLSYSFLDLDGDGGHDILLTLNYPPDHIFVVRDLGCPEFLPFVCRDCSAGN